MAKDTVKRPWSAESRTLPPDAKSLEEMFRSVHRQLVKRGEHLKQEPHDAHARRGFLTLFEQRAAAWRRLTELDQQAALRLAAEFNLVVSSEPEVR